MIEPDKVAKIRRRADDAALGYGGMKDVDYARDVGLLLVERDEFCV